MTSGKNLVVLLLLAFSSLQALACTENESSDALPGKLQAKVASIHFTQGENRNFITTLGTLKNSSRACAQDLVLEVTYANAQGQVIDVVTQNLNELVIPAADEVGFRIYDVAMQPQGAYASSKVRVLSATSKVTPESSSLAASLLANWGPVAIFFFALFWFLRRLTKNPKSPAQRSLAMMEQQTEILAQQARMLERLAAAAEQRGTHSSGSTPQQQA